MKNLLFYFTLITIPLSAQTSIFQDSKGEAAYKIFDNAVSINSSDQNISFNISKLTPGTIATNFVRKGIFIKLNAKEGISNLKYKDAFAVDGEVGVYYGQKNTSRLPAQTNSRTFAAERYLSVSAGIDRNRFFSIVNDSIKDKMISDPTVKLEIGQFGYVNLWLYGIGINGGFRTNIGDLEPNNIVTVANTTNNGTTLITNEFAAYDLNSYDKGQSFLNFNIDLGYQINKEQVNAGKMPSITAAAHFRYVVQEETKPRCNPALGLYFAAESGAPQKIGFGINIQLVDAFDVGELHNSAWERTAITLNAGYSFK